MYRYLKGTPGKAILLFSSTSLTLSGLCDSDWIGCLMTRRTMTGVCILLGSNPYFMGSEEANYWVSLLCWNRVLCYDNAHIRTSMVDWHTFWVISVSLLHHHKFSNMITKQQLKVLRIMCLMSTIQNHRTSLSFRSRENPIQVDFSLLYLVIGSNCWHFY